MWTEDRQHHSPEGGPAAPGGFSMELDTGDEPTPASVPFGPSGLASAGCRGSPALGTSFSVPFRAADPSPWGALHVTLRG